MSNASTRAHIIWTIEAARDDVDDRNYSSAVTRLQAAIAAIAVLTKENQ